MAEGRWPAVQLALLQPNTAFIRAASVSESVFAVLRPTIPDNDYGNLTDTDTENNLKNLRNQCLNAVLARFSMLTDLLLIATDALWTTTDSILTTTDMQLNTVAYS